jgi:hypothetical protein
VADACTMDELIALARAHPGTKEDEYRGQAAVCIRSTPFLLTGPDGYAVLRLPRPVQERLVQTDPTSYCASEGRWGRLGWTRLCVRRVPRAALAGLVAEAHGLAAERYAERTLRGKRA